MKFLVLLVVIGVLWFAVTAVRGARGGDQASWAQEEDDDTGIAPRVADARDIPPLYPDFYHGVLTDVGKETSPQNVLALVEYVSQMLSANAMGWFIQAGDPHAQERFSARFRGGGGDDQQLELVVDDMIDFLWAWRPATHPALRDLVPRMRESLAAPDSRLRRFPGELPFGIWEMED
ncbi:hypothetical protein [Streptomyces sp. NPDC002328]|uniref:hypothetical protein n=1 Tax=Streptomyces sp. NPDC002328 TaxID=3364642 RepID=UPI0036C21756